MSDNFPMGKNAILIVMLLACPGCKKKESAECEAKASALLQSTAILAKKACACTSLACAAEALAENQRTLDETDSQCPEGLDERHRPETRANMARALACAKRLE